MHTFSPDEKLEMKGGKGGGGVSDARSGRSDFCKCV